MNRPGAPTYPKLVGPEELEPHYSRHVAAMTEEGLHDKAGIAFQLALRDKRIAELEAVVTAAIRWRELDESEPIGSDLPNEQLRLLAFSVDALSRLALDRDSSP